MAFVDRFNSAVRRLPAWTVYVGSVAYAGWVFFQGATGALGPNPVEAIEHAYGEAALYLLIAGLAVTPLRRFAKVNLLKFRRAIGLACFFFVTAHLLTWAVLDVQALDRVWADIVKRPYITVGMAAFVLLLPLAVTSNNVSVRRLGPKWRQLHRLAYPAAVLGAVHYVMLVKGWQVKPLVMLGIILVLLALRLPGIAKPRRARAAGGAQSRA
ncbi:protein-methionine-sulfoxide reductase heme-binding subunit MsrQ [Roseovarius sp.]|uniref:protein-methionine-sulfoxide reductase heme-binding subunit MsrQ n=1 Tax=Roseovarius sp. TaxID=1486281 RepID=UPI00262B9F09|nr:protein-methionine-sulfoxide reductase heme-binding subunit MsrQ [Roseovarius sp.]MDM8167194.1 protein-methionine-sulfoxide reductase heme-binding subunit MsrQ [Roseovarius sp.]